MNTTEGPLTPDTITPWPLATYGDPAVPVGVDEDGNTISWRPEHNPHLLLVGRPGRGKAALLRRPLRSPLPVPPDLHSVQSPISHNTKEA